MASSFNKKKGEIKQHEEASALQSQQADGSREDQQLRDHHQSDQYNIRWSLLLLVYYAYYHVTGVILSDRAPISYTVARMVSGSTPEARLSHSDWTVPKQQLGPQPTRA
ncbi:unnamed protein product [Symbiodinium sp. CCMP2592]|nr:unnamed protein product [Symbiodinium sp. CCMP2592]